MLVAVSVRYVMDVADIPVFTLIPTQCFVTSCAGCCAGPGLSAVLPHVWQVGIPGAYPWTVRNQGFGCSWCYMSSGPPARVLIIFASEFGKLVFRYISPSLLLLSMAIMAIITLQLEEPHAVHLWEDTGKVPTVAFCKVLEQGIHQIQSRVLLPGNFVPFSRIAQFL